MDDKVITSRAAAPALRQSGIACLGDIPWGAHICQFYDERRDLVETLAPYFAAGLRDNEYCIWIASDALPRAEALAALRARIPSLDDDLARGRIDIFDHRDWYLSGGAFNAARVTLAWREKLGAALARGFAGMRLAGDTFWLGRDDWEAFVHYEAELDPFITRNPVIALCTYARARLGLRELLDAAANHAFTLLREGEGWTAFKSFARRRAERASSESEARLRATIDGASDGILTFDKTGAILLANAAAAQMFGYDALDMPGENIGALVSALMSEPGAGAVDYSARVGHSFAAEARRKDGSGFPIEWTIRAAAANGEQLFVGFVQDLTRQKEAEARIERLHADRVNAIGTMATALAHEINQPLAATAAYLQTAMRLLKLPEEARPARLETVLESAAGQTIRAADILKQIRAFVIRDEPNKTICDLHEIIKAATMLTKGSARQANVDVVLDLNAARAGVIADKVEMQQVLVNLSRNAIQAMANAPTRRLTISTSNTRRSIRVEIADTGRGLPEALGARLFEPFITTGDGLGVGLSICRSIIEAHYGSISAEPNPGGGARLCFTLPLANGAGAEPVAQEARKAPAGAA